VNLLSHVLFLGYCIEVESELTQSCVISGVLY